VLVVASRAGDRVETTPALPPDVPISTLVPAAVPLSWWWVVALIVVGVGATVAVYRRSPQPLVAVVFGLAVGGAVVSVAATTAMQHVGAGVANRSPEWNGVVLESRDLHFWPSRSGYDLAHLTYRDVDGVLEGERNERGVPLAFLDANRGSFDQGLPNLDSPCDLRNPQRIPGTPEWQRPHDAYCIERVDGDRMVLTADRSRRSNPAWYRTLVGYPLLFLAAILAVLAAQERWQARPRPLRSQLAHGLSFGCGALAVFITGSFALAALRVGLFGPDLERLNAVGIIEARNLMIEAGLDDQGSLLYGPAVVIGNLLAGLALLFAWVLAPGPDERHRRWVLVGLSTVAALAVATQLGFAETISVMTDLFD
jgi:hypothetical protein